MVVNRVELTDLFLSFIPTTDDSVRGISETDIGNLLLALTKQAFIAINVPYTTEEHSTIDSENVFAVIQKRASSIAEEWYRARTQRAKTPEFELMNVDKDEIRTYHISIVGAIITPISSTTYESDWS